MRPCISAYLPVYNQAGSLATAIGSVQAQTVPVGEIIVVDDASTDDSAQVAAEVGARVVRLPSNQGRGAARSRAMLECSTDLVLCCDATCALEPDFLEHALPHFDDPRVAAVFGVYGAGLERTVADRWRSRHLFKVGAYTSLDDQASFATYGAVVRRKAVFAVGSYDASHRHSEDAELDQRLRSASFKVLRDPRCQVTALISNNVWKTLERYSRWNNGCCGTTWNLMHFGRLLSYSVKVMARKDVAESDYLAAIVSLISPLYQVVRLADQQLKGSAIWAQENVVCKQE